MMPIAEVSQGASHVIWHSASPEIAQGILFSESLLTSESFTVLAAFVAINTVMYVALAIAKMLPRVYLADLRPTRGRRMATRSIYPHRRED